jgi:hypothetical protein
MPLAASGALVAVKHRTMNWTKKMKIISVVAELVKTFFEFYGAQGHYIIHNNVLLDHVLSQMKTFHFIIFHLS